MGSCPSLQRQPPSLVAFPTPKPTLCTSSWLLHGQLMTFLAGCHVTLSLFAHCSRLQSTGWAALQCQMLTWMNLHYLLLQFLNASQGILWPLSLDLEPALTSKPSTPPIFLFCLISVLFLARDTKSLVPSTGLCQARLNLRVHMEAFLRLWDHPSGSHSGREDFWQGKEVFKFHRSISPGKRESLNHHSFCVPFLQYPTKSAGSHCLLWAGLEQGMVKVQEAQVLQWCLPPPTNIKLLDSKWRALGDPVWPRAAWPANLPQEEPTWPLT